MACLNSAMLFLGLSVFVLGANAKVADYIVPCHYQDSDCLLSSAKKALPFVTKNADPFEIDNVNADSGDLKLLFPSMSVRGFSNARITKITRSEKEKASMVAVFPIDASGQYKLEGILFGQTIKGSGPCNIKTDGIELTIHINFKTFIGKDNEEHYKVAKFDYTYEPVSPVHFHFENLFDGDQAKSDDMHKLLNQDETSKVLIKTVGQPMVEAVIKKVIQINVDQFFAENANKDIEL